MTPTLQSPSLPPYTGGRGHRGFTVGERVGAISDLREGDVLIEVSHQFPSINTVVCLHGARHPHKFGDIAYFQWLGEMKTPGGFAMWYHDLAGLEGRAPRVELYRAILVPHNHRDYPFAVRAVADFRRYTRSATCFCFSPDVEVPERGEIIGCSMGKLGITDNLNLE